MRRLCVLAAVALTVGLMAPTGSPAAAAEPFCGITWGSLTKSGGVMSGAPITGARAGRHECYDRLVVDLGPGPGQPAGFHVSYVSVVVQDGSGEPVLLAGGAFLQITVAAPAIDVDTGAPTYDPADDRHAVNVAGFATFRQVAFLGTFEGITGFGLGVRARLPFRVFTLAGPGSGSRLVIDVAHRWQ
jgi:hypothetical protein